MRNSPGMTACLPSCAPERICCVVAVTVSSGISSTYWAETLLIVAMQESAETTQSIASLCIASPVRYYARALHRYGGLFQLPLNLNLRNDRRHLSGCRAEPSR